MSKLLLADIKGGLGNQLFQYATAYCLSKKQNRKLILINNCKGDRDFLLNVFNISSKIENKRFRLEYTSRKNYKYWFRKIQGISVCVYTDPLYKIDQRIFNANNSDVLVLEGYWAFKEYFNLFETEIKNLLNSRKDTLNFDRFYCSGLENSVSIHIRRGDYSKPNEVFEVLPIEYYINSIKQIESAINNPVYYVFTDDNEYFLRVTKERLASVTTRPIILTESNHSPDYIMLAMAKCQNQIIANSTFSWWAAYLNENNSKIVIQPSSWYKDSKLQNLFKNSSLLTDSNWIKL